MENLKEELFALISETLGIEEKNINLEADFYDDFNASTIEVADLALLAQNKFKISFDEKEIINIKKVADLLKLLEDNSDEL